METKAHFVLIGAFTLLMVAAGFALVLFFSNTASLSFRRTYEIEFDGGAGGLGRGSGVTYSGLRVGEVTWVDLDPKDPRKVIAYFQIYRYLPLHSDVKAQLQSQGLTGNAVIALSGGSPDAPLVKGEVGEAPLHGESAGFDSLLGQAQDISQKANVILTKVDKLIDDNTGAIDDTLKNADTFSKALSSNAPGLNNAVTAIGDLAKRAGPLADHLTKLTDDTDAIVKSLDSAKLNNIVDDISKFADVIADSRGDVRNFVSDVSAFAKRLNEATGDLSTTVHQIDNIAKAIDPQKVSSFMNGADAIGATLQENKGNIDRLIKNASELSAKLNESADKIDGVLEGAQNLIGSPDVKGLLQQVADAARSFHQLADDLDVRVKQISVGLVRFSGSGLREYEALASDGRKTLADVDRLIRSIESNPTQLIFGPKKQ